MQAKAVQEALLSHFNYHPTDDQTKAITHFSAFDLSTKPAPLYILKGYAGTGKTSLISAYVHYLSEYKKGFVLLAPTGRAAKVLAQYTDYNASTIHRRIYQVFTQKDGSSKMLLARNPSKNTVFLIDEASMINDETSQNDNVFSKRSLLDDLMTYVFSNSGNKMILVGDTAQLPPVGLQLSPALEIDYIRSAFSVTAFDFEMTTVMRQAEDSGILYSATRLRNKLTAQDNSPPFFESSHFKSDIMRINNAQDFEELLQQTFLSNDAENGILVCRTNKRANLFNQQIRDRILQRESALEGGDTLMVVKNNYYWLDVESKVGFIANGDLLNVLRVTKIEEMYGFQFADAEVQMLDYPEEKPISVKLLLDTLMADGPGLSYEDYQNLFNRVEEDYLDMKTRASRMNKMRKNPYLNALHIKFGYALTCHKTQGGQWPLVIVDQGYLNDEMINREYLRWLYTALTRATNQLFLINFSDDFFAD